MRIGLVCPYSLTIPGGVQAQVLGMARVLRAQGHEVRVLGPSDGPPPEPFVTSLGNSIPTAANGSIAPIAPDFSCVMRTIRALRDEQFDVLHLHEPLAPGPTTTTLFMHPAPCLGTFHAAGESFSYKYFTGAVRWLAGHLDARCAVSAEAAEMVQSHIGGEYEVLYNGVEIDRYATAHPVKADGPTIFFCGRHEPRKGLDVLLEAFGALPPEVRLWIGSDGPDTDRLRARYAGDPRIEWLGRLSDADKMARLRGASVFCAPSLRGESFGVVLIEAMAARTPIVATDLAGYLAVARRDQDALMVPAEDPLALAEALRRVLFDPALADRLAASGAERAETFSMETLARHYVERYQELIDAERARSQAQGRLRS